MTLQATNIHNGQYPIEDSSYFEAEIDEYLVDTRTADAAAEAEVAEAHAEAGAAAVGASEQTEPVSIAARLLDFAQTAADEHLAAARAEAERIVAEARVHADTLVADAQNQAEATKATAEQTATRLLDSARAEEAESEAHVRLLQETQQRSRTDLRRLAQHLTEIADANEGEARP
jgi:cell division septum initiation protein DivIVA